ncbi:phosphoglycerate mutase-like protein [Amylocystis lapponica]|nr:phosphoglycerate mutase-like protein [Amylocystis lapponica]
MSNDLDSTVIGVVVLARHGDRQGFYQDPDTYTASSTAITALGEQQEWQLGWLLRSLYLNISSPSYIQGATPLTDLFNVSQVQVWADGGDEGGVIVDSAAALVQGLWPATPTDSTTLANGSTIVSPLGGFQYVAINALDPDEDVALEGFTDCNTLDTRTEQFYNSKAFAQMASDSAAFLDELPPYVGGRTVSLQNIWNIFDFMNVQSIHNATFAKALPPTFLAQANALANWHEYNINSDVSFEGIGNIAFRTMLPGILNAFQEITDGEGLKIFYNAISYKPFLSLLNMTGVVADNGLPAAIVDYAASVILEVRQPSAFGEPVIRFNFKNGSLDDAFTTYPMSFANWNGNDLGDVPLSLFIDAFAPASVNSTLDWCQVCGQTQERGCPALLAAQAYDTRTHYKLSPVGAGFLGAGLTAAVILAALGVLLFLGALSFGGRRWRRRSFGSTHKGPRMGDHLELHSEVNSVKGEN